VVARAISIGGLAVAAAIYGPAAFALMGLYLGVLGVASVGMLLRYDGAVLAAADEAAVRVILRLCIFVGMAVLATFVPFLILGVQLGWVPPVFAPMLLLALAVRGLLRLGFALSTRHGDFRVIGRANLVQAVLQPLMLLALTRTHLHGATVMALADLFGHFVALLVVLRAHRRSFPGFLRDDIPFGILMASARRWSSLPALSLPGALLSMGFVMLPLIVAPMLADRELAGTIALALRILDFPTQLVAAGTTPVLLHRLSATDGMGHRRMAALAVLLLTGLVGALYSLIVIAAIVVDPWLEATKWHALADVMPLLVGFSAGIALAGPLAEAGGMFRDQRVLAITHGLAFAGGLIVLGATGSINAAALIGFSILAVARAAALGWLIVSLSRNPELVPAVSG